MKKLTLREEVRIYKAYLKRCGKNFDVIQDGKEIAQSLAIEELGLFGSKNYNIKSYNGWDFYELWDEHSRPKPTKPVIVWDYFQWGIFALNYFKFIPLSTQKIELARDILKQELKTKRKAGK